MKSDEKPQALLHGNMGEYYHRQIQRLIEWLNDPSRREQAAQIVRTLITKIELTPTPDRRELSIDLYGSLAEILLIAASNEMRHKIRAAVGLTHSQSVEIEQVQRVLADFQDSATEGRASRRLQWLREQVPLNIKSTPLAVRKSAL